MAERRKRNQVSTHTKNATTQRVSVRSTHAQKARTNKQQSGNRAEGKAAVERGAHVEHRASVRSFSWDGRQDCIEGRRAAFEALRAGFPIKRALIAQGESGARVLQQFDELLAGAQVPIERVSAAHLDALSAHGAHQGIVLQTAPFPYVSLVEVVKRASDGPALVVVLDHVTDAGNFGAIVRTAEVVGAAGVVIASRRAAEVTAATYKTSAGAVMHLPIAQVPNVARALTELKEAGFWVVGATEHAEQVCFDAPLEGRIALVMGSEGEGISRLVQQSCDVLTKLPQRGLTESLNVAQATTALCFEWLRRNRSILDV